MVIPHCEFSWPNHPSAEHHSSSCDSARFREEPGALHFRVAQIRFEGAGRGQNLDANRLQALVDQFKWFHQIDFGNGVISKGLGPNAIQVAMADVYFKDGIAGRSFLDIGCWDGLNSIEAHKRGAARVLATDHFAWNDGWGDRRAFEFARQQLAPSIESRDISIDDLSVETVGQFEVVLMAGVFYHLRHPFLALERLSKLTTQTFIIETHLDAMDQERPAMIFYPTTELANDGTNWWGPNPECVLAMLRDSGFSRVEYTPTPYHPTRGIFHGHR